MAGARVSEEMREDGHFPFGVRRLSLLIALIVFITVGKPVKTLVIVGALNGFILPIALVLILLASSQKRIIGEYLHPLSLKIIGWIALLATLYLSIKSLSDLF